jgi:hypothetical protein
MNASNVEQLRPSVEVRASEIRMVNKGALVGFFDVSVIRWGLTFKDCKLFRKDGREWVGMPSTSYTNRDGKTVYRDIIEFSDKDIAARFSEAALRALGRG